MRTFPQHLWDNALAAAALLVAMAVLNTAAADDSCMWARDGDCDEPHICAYGTDTSDCSVGPVPETTGANSCEYANNGRCDEPGIGTGWCAPNTDATDCAYGHPALA